MLCLVILHHDAVAIMLWSRRTLCHLFIGFMHVWMSYKLSITTCIISTLIIAANYCRDIIMLLSSTQKVALYAENIMPITIAFMPQLMCKFIGF